MPSDRSSVPGVIPSVPTFTHEESLEPEENGAPDPLEHAMPDGELAEEQLAVGRPAEPESDEADEAEFELEVEESIEAAGDGAGGGRRGRTDYDGDAGGSGGGAGEVAVPSPAHVERRPNIFARLIGFLQGSWRELQRVQWPDRRQVVQATGVVIGLGLGRPPHRELRVSELRVRHGVLERIRSAVLFGLERLLVREGRKAGENPRNAGALGGQSSLGATPLRRPSSPPVFGAFAITSHGSLRSAQRVSRCGV